MPVNETKMQGRHISVETWNAFWNKTLQIIEEIFSSTNLTEQIANLLECPSWMGAGPGLMDAATKGALQAGKPVGGFKIGKEAGEWTASNFHPYLPLEVYLTCRKDIFIC